MRKMQAKDLPDQALIDLIDRLYNTPRALYKQKNERITGH